MTARIHDNRTDPQWRERGIGATSSARCVAAAWSKAAGTAPAANQ